MVGGAVAAALTVAPGDEPFACGGVDVTHETGGLRELVDRDELTPRGSVGRERRPVVSAFEDLGPPVGPVVAGRFLRPGQPAPALLPISDRLGLVSGPELTALDLPSGDVAWSVRLSAPLVSGGPVGDHVALLVGGPSPAVVSVSADDGRPASCAEVPAAGPPGTPPTTLATDQVGPDVVVAAGPPGGPVTLSRLVALPAAERDRAGAWAAWERELAEVPEVADVRVVDDAVVVSRVADPVQLGEIASAGGITRPLVTAYGAADGEPVWQLPVGAGDRAAAVVGDDPGTGTVLVLEVAPAAEGRAGATRSWLVAIDTEGRERWRRPLGPGLVNATQWGDLVVVQRPAPGGGARARAYTPEGRRAWSLATADLPPGRMRAGFGPATAVGDELLVPAPDGLVVVDPATGAARPLGLDAQVDELVVVGRHLVARSGSAVLVMER